MKITKEIILDEIESTSVFKNIFNKCNQELQDILVKLIIESSQYSCNRNGYIKNMENTGVRFQKPCSAGRKSQNYCMMSLNPRLKRILVDVRTDGRFMKSEILGLNNLGNRYSGGFEWHRFAVKVEEEIEEAVRLIKECYED